MRKKLKAGIRDIAKAASLNISTVSRALNRSPLISPETTAKVLRIANELGYHQETKRKTIVIVLPSYTEPMAWYTLNMINALQATLGTKEHHWEFVNVDRLDVVPERTISGMISLDFNGSAAVTISQKYQLPLVCINDASAHLNNVYSVNSDAESGISLAFQCLYKNGHRRIAFISTGTSYAAQQRDNAFLKNSERYGISDICRCISLPLMPGLQKNIQKLYQEGFTGLIVDGESRSADVLYTLDSCNIKVPEQMSLITWEQSYVSGKLRPAITTVEQDVQQLAKKTIDLLENWWAGKQPERDILVPYRLILRDSVKNIC